MQLSRTITTTFEQIFFKSPNSTRPIVQSSLHLENGVEKAVVVLRKSKKKLMLHIFSSFESSRCSLVKFSMVDVGKLVNTINLR